MNNATPHAWIGRDWIGIDVSKQTLDVCLLREQGKPLIREFENNPAGFTKLLRWAQGHSAQANAHF